MAWLAQNAVYFVVFAAIVGALYWFLDIEGVGKAAMAAIGLGFVVFVHEFGHFAAAKWCNVHVQTFSLGFGPALPGCSFRRGETLYKIAVLPLGGYVSMVGEGFEGDDDENYPRSFKNKTVGQRMLIISAGVIMNMILGCVCFVGVFYFHGVDHPRAIVYSVEPGLAGLEGRRPQRLAGCADRQQGESELLTTCGSASPVRRGASLHVSSSRCTAGAGRSTIDLAPRKDSTDDAPIIGVSPLNKLQLQPAAIAKNSGGNAGRLRYKVADRGRVVCPSCRVTRYSRRLPAARCRSPRRVSRFVGWAGVHRMGGQAAGQDHRGRSRPQSRLGREDNWRRRP